MKYRYFLWIWLFFVAGICLLPWWQRVYFFYDDIDLLMQFRSPSLVSFFRPHSFQCIPAFQFFYWLEIQLFGIRPSFFLLVSVAIHLINIYLVYRIILRLTRKTPFAWLAAVLVSFNKSYYPIIFWPTMQTSTLATTFSLLSTILFFKLQSKLNQKHLGFLGAAILTATFFYAFGTALGIVFALTAALFWKKSPAKNPVIAICLTTSLVGLTANLVSALPTMSQRGTGIVGNFTPRGIFNLLYFTAVGPSQAIISRFFLPGFLPNVHDPLNVLVMILLPSAVLLLVILTLRNILKKNQAHWKKEFMPQFLFGGLLTAPYAIVAFLRSGKGAHKALAERYVYLPSFFFVLLLVSGLALLSRSSAFNSPLPRAIARGSVIIIVAGHLLMMMLNTHFLFSYLE